MSRSSGMLPVGGAVPSLACRGISPGADLAYRHLVLHGPGTARELARDLGMGRAGLSAALDELTAIGAVVPRSRVAPDDAQWVARSPAEVITRFRGAGPARPPGAGRTGSRRPPAVEAAAAIPLGDGLRHLPSREATRARLAELVAVAGREHLAMHPEQAFDDASLRAAAPMDRTLLDRGVRMRVLGVQREKAAPGHHRHEPADDRLAYRLANDLPVKLLILDRAVALFPVAPNQLERGYLEVAQPPMVAALVELFERQWETAGELPGCPVPPVTLTYRERALVALLAQGHTDASAARLLRVSPRSVSYTLRSLMDRLGVNNRFQLGLTLGAAGSVPPPASQ